MSDVFCEFAVDIRIRLGVEYSAGKAKCFVAFVKDNMRKFKIDIPKLKKAMQAERYNGKTLAFAVGVSQDVIYRGLQGSTIPNAETFRAICNLLNVDMNEMFIEIDDAADAAEPKLAA